MMTTIASAITKAASQQTYYTIRFLADRDRVEDAYRAYAYFRWVDDLIDADLDANSELRNIEISRRRDFLERQKSLLERCYQGETSPDANTQENILVELVQRDHEKNSGLQSYLRTMMRVLDFDAKRRGKLISQTELDEYTHWLAVSVTEALHYFIGHGEYAPHDETRYLAVSAAHIAHLLRDTFEDLRQGYYNIPREVLEANAIGPQDVHSEAYRSWVRGRVQLARNYFQAGRSYIERVQNGRTRLAGFAYLARFEWLLDTIEREDYALRPQYNESISIGTSMRKGWLTLSATLHLPGTKPLPHPTEPNPLGKKRTSLAGADLRSTGK